MMSNQSRSRLVTAVVASILAACASDDYAPNVPPSPETTVGRADSALHYGDISLQLLGRYQHASGFAPGTAEIVAHDPASQRLFVVNPEEHSLDVIDIAVPSAPVLFTQIDTSPYGAAANSVAVRDGILAVAIEAENKQAPGQAVFFNADGGFLASVQVGALPDMITWSPDGKWVVVANEGEPNDDYTVDPEGSVSVIDLRWGLGYLGQHMVRHATFTHLSRGDLDPSVRVYGPSASVAQDFEPEFITISADSRHAYVTLQENNAIAVVSIREARVLDVMGLGFKDHRHPRNGFDASDRDNGIGIRPHPVYGMYQPDAIASMDFFGQTILFTASEGDSRDYAGFSEEARVADLVLDPAAFPNAAALQAETQLGRLKVTTTLGDEDGDGDYDALYAYGARSFSIWTASGALIYDSGSDFERITAFRRPQAFNSDNEANQSKDARSDDKGPEPETVVLGQVGARTYAFIGLERIGGFMVYDVSFPFWPRFIQYVNDRDFSADAETGGAHDLAPEGMIFISASDSPTGKPLLVAAHEVSGSTTLYEIN